MTTTHTIADVAMSDSGYYATVDGKPMHLTGWEGVMAPEDMRCDQCGTAEVWARPPGAADDDEMECEVALYAEDLVCLCSRCIKAADHR